MNNLDPAELHGQAAYVSGRHKPLYMMQGLDATADVVFMVGYHGSISGESSVLSHTYNPAVVSHVSLNGTRVGESGINALVAPTVSICGEDPLAVFRSFVGVTYITRVSEGR